MSRSADLAAKVLLPAAEQVDSIGSAVQAARRAVSQGADILDVGGQSTRPGATPLDGASECARIIPALRSDFLTCMRWSRAVFKLSTGAGLHLDSGGSACPKHSLISRVVLCGPWARMLLAIHAPACTWIQAGTCLPEASPSTAKLWLILVAAPAELWQKMRS